MKASTPRLGSSTTAVTTLANLDPTTQSLAKASEANPHSSVPEFAKQKSAPPLDQLSSQEAS